ncbi:MAG: DedA family protein [Pirellulales bacterium]|nr:DedA family protein [Pirellulales bacterium]
MTEFLLAHGSYLAIIIVLILTGAGLPVPEEVPIVAAGLLSAHGKLDPWLAMGACLFGALAGDVVMYWIGRHFGRAVLRERHWWARLVSPEREAQVEQMLQNHGLKVFFLARFLVGLRSPVYLSAGILRVPFRRFFLIDLFCATAVIGTFFGLSYYYGATITHWIRRAEVVLTIVVVLTIIAVGIYFWRRHHRDQNGGQSGDGLVQDNPAPSEGEVDHVVEPETRPWNAASGCDAPCVASPKNLA